MSAITSNNIANSSGITDKNISFSKTWCEKQVIKGFSSICYYGTLTYTPSRCSNCGFTSETVKIIKYGTKLSRITLTKSANLPTYLFLKKQRFYCEGCHTTFTASSSLVKRNCFISKRVIQAISSEGQFISSEKDIAYRHSVSPTTVNRAIHQWSHQFKPSYGSLPAHLSMDEFKSVKSADSQMSFIFTDARKHEIMDILPTRRLHHLRDYFLNYSYEARASVKTVVVDMNAPYTSLIRDVFPKAIVIIDRFHLVQLVMRSLNQTRIKLMNRYNTSRPEDKKVYRKLKSYWKLLLKNKTELSDSDYRYQRLFKGPKSSMGIIDYIMTLDVEFKATYQVAQNLLVAVQHKNISAYQTLVLSENKLISPQMKRSLRTLKKYLPEIANSFKYNDSNGHLEGINNKIKMIKRISFGYRNFTNFRNRILLGFNNKRVAS